MTLQNAMYHANACDDAFEQAVKAAGFKSRWHTPALWQGSATRAKADANLVATYDAKVKADWAMHEAFVAARAAA